MVLDDEIEELVYKLAIKNAVEHGGKAREKAVLGKILGERPKLRNNIRDISNLIKKIIEELNKLSVNHQRKILEDKWPDLFSEKKEGKDKTLPPLTNVDRYSVVVTRFSPNPDCVLHIGSIRALILSHDYARIYKGKFLLRFEDTDPRLKKSVVEYYDLIRDDVRWLGCKWDGEFNQSDRLPTYYDHTKKLMEIGGAYVCTCDSTEFKRKLIMGKSCECRNRLPSEQMMRWKRMLDGIYGEGEAVVRVKTDLGHPNPAVRDWPALRIIDTIENPHPRVGSRYRVWPLYNFACGVDDHLMGITHIIRGKEHLTNMVRQKYLYDYFKWEYPEAIHYGRLKIPNATLSKSKIIEALQKKQVTDLSDPRLATLIALKRRGIVSNTLRKIVTEIGPRPVDVTLSWENIYAINRKIVDKIANRYFFISCPIRLSVKRVSKNFSIKIPLHPDCPERGYRFLNVSPKNNIVNLLVSRNDYDLFKNNKVVRLMGLFNIEIDDTKGKFVNSSFKGSSQEDAKKVKAPIIHWLPEDGNFKTNIVMPTMEILKGLVEDNIQNEKVGNAIQLVRFGFGRIDSIENEFVRIYYSHS